MSCQVLYNNTIIYDFKGINCTEGSHLPSQSSYSYDVYYLVNSQWVLSRENSSSYSSNYQQFYVYSTQPVASYSLDYSSLVLPSVILACGLFWFLYKMLWGARR